MNAFENIVKKNPGLNILECSDSRFQRYGKIISGIDTSSFTETAMSKPGPQSGVEYIASIPALENLQPLKKIASVVFGGIPVQAGWVRGYNLGLNAFEFHKSSEVISAVTDLILILGHKSDISGKNYDVSKTEIFFQNAGSTVELFSDTLHFAPAQASHDPFCAVIILPAGTNTPLEHEILSGEEGEPRLLFMKNKWLIAYPGSVQEQKGGYPGMTGGRISIFL